MKFIAKIDAGNGGQETFVADSIAEAWEEAKAWARTGDWDTTEGTVWADICVESEDREQEKSGTITIDPDEPGCIDGEHDWQSPYEIVGGLRENPGVFGNGGGIEIYECCVKCGCRKIKDTWAQNPSNGVQGLQSVCYNPGYYAESLKKNMRTDSLAAVVRQ